MLFAFAFTLLKLLLVLLLEIESCFFTPYYHIAFNMERDERDNRRRYDGSIVEPIVLQEASNRAFSGSLLPPNGGDAAARCRRLLRRCRWSVSRAYVGIFH